MSETILDGFGPKPESRPIESEAEYEGQDHQGRTVKRRAFAGVKRSKECEKIRAESGPPSARHELPEIYRERIRQRLAEGVPAAVLMDQYNVNEQTIRYIGQ